MSGDGWVWGDGWGRCTLRRWLEDGKVSCERRARRGRTDRPLERGEDEDEGGEGGEDGNGDGDEGVVERRTRRTAWLYLYLHITLSGHHEIWIRIHGYTQRRRRSPSDRTLAGQRRHRKGRLGRLLDAEHRCEGNLA